MEKKYLLTLRIPRHKRSDNIDKVFFRTSKYNNKYFLNTRGCLLFLPRSDIRLLISSLPLRNAHTILVFLITTTNRSNYLTTQACNSHYSYILNTYLYHLCFQYLLCSYLLPAKKVNTINISEYNSYSNTSLQYNSNTYMHTTERS